MAKKRKRKPTAASSRKKALAKHYRDLNKAMRKILKLEKQP